MKPCLRGSLFATLILAGIFTAAGCGEKPAETKPNAPAAAAPKEVVWAELRELDNISHEIDFHLKKGEFNLVREDLAKVIELVGTVSTQELPPNALDPAKASLRQAELASISEALAGHAELSDEDLQKVLQAMHPLVLALMEAAGLPHKHDDHDHDHDHSHDGHSH